MSAKEKRSLWQQVGRGILYCGIILLVLLFVLVLTGGRGAFIIEIPFRLICGWALHGWKELPPFFGKWQAAVLPLGCLLLAAALAHRFIRRWVEAKRPALGWRIRHTAAVFSLILLCSAAAIATSGIVHQLFWLGRGKILNSNMSRARDLGKAMNQGKEISIGLVEFFEANKRYPKSFDELDVPAELLWFTPDGGSAPEPFLLLRPGATSIALEEDPLLVSPLLPRGTGYVVGFGDTSVRRISSHQLRGILDSDAEQETHADE